MFNASDNQWYGFIVCLIFLFLGEHSKITLNTKNVFIEATATDLQKAIVVLDTVVTMFSQYCKLPFTVEPVEVIYEADGRKELYPVCVLHSNYINCLEVKLSRHNS